MTIVVHEDKDFIIEHFYNKSTDNHFYHLYQKEYLWRWNWYNAYVGCGETYEAVEEAMSILKKEFEGDVDEF